MQKNTRVKVTNDQIITAIEQLNAQGVRPTIRAVREHLGNTGSPNRIQPLLAAWHDKNKPAEAAAVLSDSAQQSLAELFARERSAAVASKLEEIAELKAQLEEITQAGQQIEDENERLEAANTQLDEQKSEAVTLASSRLQRIEQLEQEQARLQAQCQELGQQVATAQAQLAMQQQQGSLQQQQIEQQAEALADARQQVSTAQQIAAVAEAKQQAAAETATAAAQRIQKLEAQLEQFHLDAVKRLDTLQKRVEAAQQQRSTDTEKQTHNLGEKQYDKER